MNKNKTKRFMDLFFIVLFLPLLLLLGLFVWVLVRLKMGNPVFFRQERPGLNGVPFKMIKFRTMNNAVDSDGNLLSNDKRLSDFGRFLRSSSLDELPEFLNVIKGEMSIVGPRPLLMEYLPKYSIEQARRHDVRPGITGWAQVNGRNAISWNEKFLYDIWYVDHHSLLLDLKIISLTVKKVIYRNGINASESVTMTPFEGDKIDGRAE